MATIYLAHSPGTGNRFNVELMQWLHSKVKECVNAKVFVQVRKVTPSVKSYLEACAVKSTPVMEIKSEEILKAFAVDIERGRMNRFSIGNTNIQNTLENILESSPEWQMGSPQKNKAIAVSEGDDEVKQFLMSTLADDDDEDEDDAARIDRAKRLAANRSAPMPSHMDSHRPRAHPTNSGMSHHDMLENSEVTMSNGSVPNMSNIFSGDDQLSRFWENQEETEM